MSESRNILVVDDDASIREILSTQLTRLGYAVTLACDGEEAVAAFQTEAPDAILMDVMMPRLDGLAACRQIRVIEKKSGAGRRTPILFLTARGSTYDKTSAVLSGGDEFVAKPVSLQELRERLDLALKKAKPS